MFNNLTLYYLNQLGIYPWVLNKETSSLLNKQDVLKPHLLQIVIIKSLNFNSKAELLLNKLMNYIDLDDSNSLMMNINKDNESQPDYLYKRIKEISPSAIIIFNNESEELYNTLKVDCPLVLSIDPDYLLNNPSAKRKAYHDLTHIKGLFPKH